LKTNHLATLVFAMRKNSGGGFVFVYLGTLTCFKLAFDFLVGGGNLFSKSDQKVDAFWSIEVTRKLIEFSNSQQSLVLKLISESEL
jgi:hypothetical protein